MRLIDVDKLIYQSHAQHIQPYINKKDIDNAPTVEIAEDCISREQALEMLGDEPENWTDTEKEIQEVNDYRWFKSILESLPSVTPQPCEDAVSRAEVYDIITRMFTSIEMTNEEYKNAMQLVKELPCVRPKSLYEDIISRIEQVRDNDKNAGEYPYNRCIEIIKEVMG